MTTAEIRDRNRQLANDRRCALMQTRRDLGRLSYDEARMRLADMILSPDELTGVMSLEKLLMSAPRIGPWMTDRYLDCAAIRCGTIRVRDLDPDRRSLLAAALRRGNFEKASGDLAERFDEVVEERDQLLVMVATLREQCRRLRETS